MSELAPNIPKRTETKRYALRTSTAEVVSIFFPKRNNQCHQTTRGSLLTIAQVLCTCSVRRSGEWWWCIAVNFIRRSAKNHQNQAQACPDLAGQSWLTVEDVREINIFFIALHVTRKTDTRLESGI